MFDDLDDPAFPGPRPDAREVVAHRAARIKRNRRIGVATGLASVLLFAGAVTAGVASRLPEGGDSVEPLTTGGPSASGSPTPSASPSASVSPTPSATRTRQAGGQPPPVVQQPTPTPPRPPDLVGEWIGNRHVETCRPAASLAPGMTNNAHVSLRLEVPAAIDSSNPGMARLVLTNISDEDAYFVYRGAERGPVHTVATDDNGTYSAQTIKTGPVGRASEGDDETRSANLQPGESEVVQVPILLDTCVPDRTATAPGAPAWLPHGTYRMAVTIRIVDWLDWDPRQTTGPAGSESPSPSPSENTPVLISSDVVTVTVG